MNNLTLLADLSIYIAVHSLKYGDNSVSIKEVTREQYTQMKAAKKSKKDYQNVYFERVTHVKANKINQDNHRAETKKQYDQAIMKKYNVGQDYKNNRWFMEQVRPTIN